MKNNKLSPGDNEVAWGPGLAGLGTADHYLWREAIEVEGQIIAESEQKLQI